MDKDLERANNDFVDALNGQEEAYKAFAAAGSRLPEWERLRQANKRVDMLRKAYLRKKYQVNDEE